MSSFVELKKYKHKREVSGIPEDIKPKLTSYKIDVMFWGVRHLRKLHGISITKPKVTLDCTVAVLESDILHKHEQNFAIHRKELVVVRNPFSKNLSNIISSPFFVRNYHKRTNMFLR